MLPMRPGDGKVAMDGRVDPGHGTLRDYCIDTAIQRFDHLCDGASFMRLANPAGPLYRGYCFDYTHTYNCEC